MGAPELGLVNVARLRAVDRPEVVGAYVGARVDVTAGWGATSEARSRYRGLAAAVAVVFGEPGVWVLVLLTDDDRVLAIKLSRLLTITPEGRG